LQNKDIFLKELKESSPLVLTEFDIHQDPLKVITKSLDALTAFKVAYVSIVFCKNLLGTLSFIFSDGEEKAFIDKHRLMLPFINQFAFSIAHAACCYNVKQRRYEAINGMIAVIEALDPYTRDHSKNVANYALLLAEELKLSPQKIEEVYYGALFHDVGKVGIPLSILHKTEELTADEYEVMKEHPKKGAKILECFSDFKKIVPIVLCHHEMYGGGGYPDGIAGEKIPFEARLVAVVDAYDAITTNRAYRRAQGCKTAIEVIIKTSTL